MGVAIRGHLGSLPGFEIGLYECPHPSPLQITLRIFYLKQMLLRKDWEQYFPQNKQMGNTTWSPMAAEPLTAHEKNYHSTKLEFLALKWAILEHVKEYLLYQPFLVRTDNNPLTYILTTPNLDATGH